MGVQRLLSESVVIQQEDYERSTSIDLGVLGDSSISPSPRASRDADDGVFEASVWQRERRFDLNSWGFDAIAAAQELEVQRVCFRCFLCCRPLRFRNGTLLFQVPRSRT